MAVGAVAVTAAFVMLVVLKFYEPDADSVANAPYISTMAVGGLLLAAGFGLRKRGVSRVIRRFPELPR